MNKTLSLIMVIFSVQAVISANPTPPTPPPPGLPIDGSIVVLFFLALATGYYLSKKYISTKKGSL